MQNSALGVALLLFLGALSSPGCSAPGLNNAERGGSGTPVASSADESVAAVLDQYLQAFRTKDRELIARVYAHDGDLVVFGSNAADRRVGWEATRQYFQKYFAEVDSIEIVLKERRIKLHQSGGAAWFSQVLDWKERAGREVAQIADLRITGVLEKRNNQWAIVQLHASGPFPVVSALP